MESRTHWVNMYCAYIKLSTYIPGPLYRGCLVLEVQMHCTYRDKICSDPRPRPL